LESGNFHINYLLNSDGLSSQSLVIELKDLVNFNFKKIIAYSNKKKDDLTNLNLNYITKNELSKNSLKINSNASFNKDQDCDKNELFYNKYESEIDKITQKTINDVKTDRTKFKINETNLTYNPIKNWINNSNQSIRVYQNNSKIPEIIINKCSSTINKQFSKNKTFQVKPKQNSLLHSFNEKKKYNFSNEPISGSFNYKKDLYELDHVSYSNSINIYNKSFSASDLNLKNEEYKFKTSDLKELKNEKLESFSVNDFNYIYYNKNKKNQSNKIENIQHNNLYKITNKDNNQDITETINDGIKINKNIINLSHDDKSEYEISDNGEKNKNKKFENSFINEKINIVPCEFGIKETFISKINPFIKNTSGQKLNYYNNSPLISGFENSNIQLIKELNPHLENEKKLTDSNINKNLLASPSKHVLKNKNINQKEYIIENEENTKKTISESISSSIEFKEFNKIKKDFIKNGQQSQFLKMKTLNYEDEKKTRKKIRKSTSNESFESESDIENDSKNSSNINDNKIWLLPNNLKRPNSFTNKSFEKSNLSSSKNINIERKKTLEDNLSDVNKKLKLKEKNNNLNSIKNSNNKIDNKKDLENKNKIVEKNHLLINKNNINNEGKAFISNDNYGFETNKNEKAKNFNDFLEINICNPQDEKNEVNLKGKIDLETLSEENNFELKIQDKKLTLYEVLKNYNYKSGKYNFIIYNNFYFISNNIIYF